MTKEVEKVVLYDVLCIALGIFCGKMFRRCSEMTVRDILNRIVAVRT